jgi:hypothetical protein
VRLCIADPPYPPFMGAGGPKNRASRWYGNGQRGRKDRPADRHELAHEWDDPMRHRWLLEELVNSYEGWAIATSPDGIAAYGTLPVECRIMAWVKPNASPGAHRIGSKWEAVIVYPPVRRRSNRGGVGMMSDVLLENAPRGFIGAKPPAWTRWVLDALSYDPDADTLTDLFHGSGAVAAAAAQGTLL